MSEIFVASNIRIPKGELTFSYSRSRGPGGQNVNKVNSKATLRWSFLKSTHIDDYVKQRILSRWRGRVNKLDELVIHSDAYREQPRNSEACIKKLCDIVLDAAKREKRRKKTKPSKGSIKRRLESKKNQSNKKQRRKSVNLDS
ncbi:MAG: alternative ribosome rescue aminoacyl-tRNA hydrolase ArfB [Pirellulales bacterium]|jgi:ribosome-associated protein